MLSHFKIGQTMNYHYNMKEIPQHCLDTFKERFNSHPSVIEVYPECLSNEDIDKLFNKSPLLWFDYFLNIEYKPLYNYRLYEYDSSGILILRKSETKIFILTRVDKQNAVDFLLLQIKKLTKEITFKPFGDIYNKNTNEHRKG